MHVISSRIEETTMDKKVDNSNIYRNYTDKLLTLSGENRNYKWSKAWKPSFGFNGTDPQQYKTINFAPRRVDVSNVPF